MDEVVEQYDDIDLVDSVMNETRFIAEKLDVTFRERPEQRIAHAAKLRGHKTSMLQDMERGKPTEIEAIVGAVREIGHITGADTPYLNTLYSLVKQKERFSPPYRTRGAS
jgi:2-dehydropantoate 2-reductase